MERAQRTDVDPNYGLGVSMVSIGARDSVQLYPLKTDKVPLM